MKKYVTLYLPKMLHKKGGITVGQIVLASIMQAMATDLFTNPMMVIREIMISILLFLIQAT